jgi:signal transduction histidine kinase
MQLTFRFKLLLGQLALVGVVMVVVTVVLDRGLTADLHEQLDTRLEQQARGAAQWVNQNRHPEKLAARLADVVGARVTILDDRGAILASSQEGGEPDVLPEVQQALGGGVGRATRSATDGNLVSHVVVQAGDDGFVRLSAPLSNIDHTVAEVRNQLLYASLLGVLAAIALSLIGAALAARPLRKMTQAAERIAEGDYDVELPPRTADDFGLLSDALGTLALQLKRDMSRIQQLERARRDFVANASHELRTPVTAIQGFAETLQDGDTDEETRQEFLEAIQRNAKRVGVLVSRILKLSELESRAPEDIVAEPVDVRAITQQAVRGARTTAKADVDIDVELPDAFVAWADPLGVEEVLDNLLENALKYGADGGIIKVVGEVVDDGVELSVIDRGKGMAPEHTKRIFERFYRVDKGRSRDKGGTGLGLAIVKHLCEAMGGSIQVDSAPGEGTRFTVHLPSPPPRAV